MPRRNCPPRAFQGSRFPANAWFDERRFAMRSISVFPGKPTLAAFVVLSLLLIAPYSASAQVKPGDFITAATASKVKDLLSPGEYWRAENGMSMKIVPTERIDWPPPYKEATEKYSSQVRLTPDRRSLVGYVAGQPFPLLDPNDPDIATKIMWNYFFRPISTDDFDLRFFDAESVYAGF